MSRSLFALLPLLCAFLAAPALAEEPAAGNEAAVPLWHQKTKDAVAAEPKQEPNAEAKQETDAEAKQETKQEPGAEPKQEPGAEPKQEPGAEPKREPGAEPKREPGAEPKQEPNAEAAVKEEEANKEVGKEAGKPVEFGTLEQYRICMDSEDRIKDLRKMLEEHIAQNNAMMLEIKRQANLLLEIQSKLVMTDDVQVDIFNKRTDEHNKLVHLANESSEKLNTEMEAFNTASMEHNQNCASLIVKKSDRDAVIKERTPAINQ